MYNGISAALMRALVNSGIRFSTYNFARTELENRKIKRTFTINVVVATLGGLVGGIVGSPVDAVTIRMQNDFKLPPDQRRK